MPATLQKETSATSRLNLPLGSHSASDFKIQESLAIAQGKVALVGDPNSVAFPAWLAEKYPDVALLRLPTVTRGPAASIVGAMKVLGIPSLLTVTYGDSLFVEKACGGLTGNILVVGEPQTAGRWAPVSRGKEGNLVVNHGRRGAQSQQVLAGHFQIAEPGLLNELLRSTRGTTSDWLKQLQHYDSLAETKFRIVNSTDWLDVGNYDGYHAARKRLFITRPGKLLSTHGDWVHKDGKNKEKIHSECRWFFNLDSGLRKFCPEVRREASGYSTRYIPSPTLGERLVFGNPDRANNLFAMGKLDEWLDNSSNQEPSKHQITNFITFTRDKFLQRLQHVEAFLEAEKLRCINVDGIPVSLPLCLPDLALLLRSAELSRDAWGYIHGDLYFGNIFSSVSRQEFKLIDPRGDFGHNRRTGPRLYEWGKLAQSIYGGFDAIERNHFKMTKEGGTALLKFERRRV